MLKALRIGAALHLVVLAWLLVVLPAFGFVLGTRPNPALAVEPRLQPGSRLERVGATWHCHLAGSARDRGFACGQLTAPIMARHEQELFATLETLVPWFLFRHLILGVVSFNNRSLESFLLPDEVDAIAGIARGYRAAGDPHAFVGPTYGRILGYHALHDASQYLIDNPLINAPHVGCSAVAVLGKRAANGHLLVARLFDFEGGRSFDFDKVVYTVAPEPQEGGQPRLRFVHVAWGGVHGAVTGFNEAGLWASVNAGISDHFARHGRPLVVAVHRVLETCTTIEEAIAHLTGAPVFVSESVLLAGPSATGQPTAVCLELAPGRHHVRAMLDEALLVTNHFLHADWQTDAANQSRRAEGTTTARYARLQARVAALPAHTPESLCEVLRDRSGPDGADFGFGHRSAINSWIGAHLVVADLTDRVLWVCEPEHGLGTARAFDLAGARPDLPAIPASADLALYDR
ncbi:MAG: C45 family peptidase, partial [Planctomycetota bacterium]